MTRSLVVLAGALLFIACPGNQKSCKLQSDCPETERCVGGACTLICRVDRDCEGLGQCLKGQCVLVVNGGGSGGDGGGSAGGSAGGTAGGAAGGTAGGSAGGAAGGAAGGTAGGSAGGTAGGAAGGSAGGAAGGSAGGSTQGGFGDPCAMSSQCQSNLCLGATGAQQGICTISCANESVCQPGMACIAISGTKVCVPSDSGRPCTNGCFDGVCLGSGATGVCATHCDSTRACPQNGDFTCSPAAGVNGRICIPAGGACSSASGCHSNFCERKATNLSDGICSNLCRDRFDCPDGWGCGLDDDGTGTTVSVCQPVGEACTITGNSNDCYSQNCVTPDMGGPNFCSALCMNTQLQPQPARCPASWSCNPVPVGSSTYYVCEP